MTTDIERSIVKSAEHEGRGFTSSVSKRWQEYKAWCTEDFIARARTDPTHNELLDRAREGKSMFTLVDIKDNYNFRQSGVTEYDYDVILTIFNPVTMSVSRVIYNAEVLILTRDDSQSRTWLRGKSIRSR